MAKKKITQNINCTTELNDANKEGNNMMKKTMTLEEILAHRDGKSINDGIEKAILKFTEGKDFPTQEILAAVRAANFAGRTRVLWTRNLQELPNGQVLLDNGYIRMVLTENANKEDYFPYLLQIHCTPVSKTPKVVEKKVYTDEGMQAKLARYLDGPFKGHDALISAITKEVSLRAKPFGVVFFHVYTDVAKALAVPAPREGDGNPTSTNYGGPGHSKKGFVPEDGVFLHLVYDEPKQARHHFRIVLPESIRPEAGTMLRVRPFYYGVSLKDNE